LELEDYFPVGKVTVHGRTVKVRRVYALCSEPVFHSALPRPIKKPAMFCPEMFVNCSPALGNLDETAAALLGRRDFGMA